jgi:hypothetical protein
MKVVRLSALRTGRLNPPGNIPGTHFCYRLSRLQGHSAARRIKSMKNSYDTIGNQTRDLPACSAVPQPTKFICSTTVFMLAVLFYIRRSRVQILALEPTFSCFFTAPLTNSVIVSQISQDSFVSRTFQFIIY